MSKKNVLLKFILFVFKHNKLEVALEGGAALYFVFGLERKMSNDVDFTVYDQNILDNFIEACVSFSEQNKYLIAVNKKNGMTQVDFVHNRKHIFSADVYLISKEYTELKRIECNFDRNNSFSLLTHSIEDICAEKICCLLDTNRHKINDVFDLENILEMKIDLDKTKTLLNKKIAAKKLKYNYNLLKKSLNKFENVCEVKEKIFLMKKELFSKKTSA